MAPVAGPLEPDGLFWSRAEALLTGLSEAVRRALPGWKVKPFGSYLQGTCLSGAILDVALVPEDGLDVRQSHDAVERLAASLMRFTTAFEVVTPFRRDGPLRLQAGDFSRGRQIAQQELNLYLGDASVGAFDLIIKQLLRADRRARPWVLVVKHWARSEALGTGPGSGGYHWTMFAVFFLQLRGVLPPIAALFDKAQQSTVAKAKAALAVATASLSHSGLAEAVNLSDEAIPEGHSWLPLAGPANATTAAGAADDIGGLMRDFAAFLLAFLALPEPRPAMDFWHGKLRHRGYEAVDLSGKSRSSASKPSKFLLQVRLALESLHDRSPTASGQENTSPSHEPAAPWRSFPPFSWSASSFRSPPPAPSLREGRKPLSPVQESEATPPVSDTKTPSSRLSKTGSTYGSAAAYGSAYGSTGTGSAGSGGSEPRSVAPDTEAAIPFRILPPFPLGPAVPAPAVPPPAGLSERQRVASLTSAGTKGQGKSSARGEVARSGRGAKWSVDSKWLARKLRDGVVVEEVQLDPEQAGGLSREEWERRFSRREHQVRIGKATAEYRKLQEFRAAPRFQDAPGGEDLKTPRVAAQVSKSAFEESYREWRVRLHALMDGLAN